jgi:Sulfotransferase family
VTAMTKGCDDTPFFVLGAARSGTTMLRLMLNRHSRLAIPFESHFLRTILVELPTNRLLGPKEAARMADIVTGERNFQTWHLDEAQVRRELIGRAPASLAELVDALYRMEIAGSGKPRWGDKTPYYYLCWRQLMGLFPGSRLVHIIRDGRDVNLSLEKVGWHGPTASDRARYWQERVEMAHDAARELGPERNLIIRYEEVVLNTPTTLELVCDFLKERFEPEMLNFFTDATSHICNIDGDVHQKVRRAPRPEDVGRWQREMPIERQREFEAVAGRGLRAMSYPCRFFNGGDSP